MKSLGVLKIVLPACLIVAGGAFLFLQSSDQSPQPVNKKTTESVESAEATRAVPLGESTDRNNATNEDEPQQGKTVAKAYQEARTRAEEVINPKNNNQEETQQPSQPKTQSSSEVELSEHQGIINQRKDQLSRYSDQLEELEQGASNFLLKIEGMGTLEDAIFESLAELEEAARFKDLFDKLYQPMLEDKILDQEILSQIDSMNSRIDEIMTNVYAVYVMATDDMFNLLKDNQTTLDSIVKVRKNYQEDRTEENAQSLLLAENTLSNLAKNNSETAQNLENSISRAEANNPQSELTKNSIDNLKELLENFAKLDSDIKQEQGAVKAEIMSSAVAEPSSSITAINTYPYQAQCPSTTLNSLVAYGGYVCQCTSYAGWKVFETYGVRITSWGNANQWGSRASNLGYRVDDIPAPGAVAYSTLGSYGHVAWVESVNANGTIAVSEYNYNVLTDFSYRNNVPASAYRYIHFD